jgi:hypothetical protein
MTVSTFAGHLGVRPSTASGWEHHHTPPSLSVQAVLDDILKQADADVRTRFALLLDTSPHPLTTTTASGSNVTPLHRPAGTRTAS